MQVTELIDLVKISWPCILGVIAFVWTLLSSRFAWWLSGKLSIGISSRIVNAVIFWLLIVLSRLYIFIRLMFRGIMPWTQMLAWRTFVKVIRCYDYGKLQTSNMVFITILTQGFSENEVKKKKNELDLADIGKSDNHGYFISDIIVQFLLILFSSGRAEQVYVNALATLIKRRDENKFWGGFINKVSDVIKDFDFKKSQNNLITLGKVFCDKVVELAKTNSDSDLAKNAVLLWHQVDGLDRCMNLPVGKRKLEERIFAIAKISNDIGARVYVLYNFLDNQPAVETKLEAKPAVTAKEKHLEVDGK